MFKLKKPLIVGGVIAVTGTIMMIGSVNQANFDFSWDKGVKLVDVQKSEQSFKNVKNLNVNAGAGVIRIEEGAEWSVTAWGVDGEKATATQKGDTLSVEAIKDEGLLRGAFFSTPEAFEYSAKITVPSGTKIENLNLTMDDGGVIIDGISAKNTKITSGRGGANLREFTGDVLSMTTKDGRLSLDDVSLKSMKVTGRDASIYGSFLKVTDESQIELRDGNVNISAVDVPGLNLETSKQESAFAYVTQLSEDEAYEDPTKPFSDYEFGLDMDDKKAVDKARKAQVKAKNQKKYTKGNQDKALNIVVRDGQILLYDMKK